MTEGIPNIPKLLYLGFAFPPGVAGRFPEAQPAGHLIETCLISSLGRSFDVRSVAISWIDVDQVRERDGSPGLPNALNLLDTKPALVHRYRSLARLKHAYRTWAGAGWVPDLVVVCNLLSPVYNAFIRWLKSQPGSPPCVLYLADSMDLQRELPWAKRLRYRLKPLKWTDPEMVPCFEACVAVSRSTESYFVTRKMPWLWLPNGCDPARVIRAGEDRREGPVQFGYFGTLAQHGGLPALLRIFTQENLDAALHVCGYGKTKDAVAAQCQAHPRLQFHPPRTPDECVRFATTCDVMVNPRPIVPGNENNFSSKVFEYALSGRAILTSRLSGVDLILGPEAFYFDAEDFERSLAEALRQVAVTPRAELRRRGAAIQERVQTEFSWERQGKRFGEFLRGVLETRGRGRFRTDNQ